MSVLSCSPVWPAQIDPVEPWAAPLAPAAPNVRAADDDDDDLDEDEDGENLDVGGDEAEAPEEPWDDDDFDEDWDDDFKEDPEDENELEAEFGDLEETESDFDDPGDGDDG